MQLKILILSVLIFLVSCKERGKKSDRVPVNTTVEEAHEIEVNPIVSDTHKKLNNNSKVSSNNRADAIDGILYRTIEGEEVKIKLNGKFRTVVGGTKNKNGAGSGYDTLPLLIDEVIPNVVRYDQYVEDDFISEYDHKPYHHKRPEPKLLEFFNEEGKLIKTYDIEANNPYIHNNAKNIRIKREFWDSEIYDYAPPELHKENEIIVAYHTRTFCKADSDAKNFVNVMYRNSEISQKGWIRRVMTTNRVFNAKGAIVWEHQWEGLSEIPAITGDGQCGMIAFYEYASANGSTGLGGWELWDIKNTSLLYKEINTDPNRIISGLTSSIVNNQYLKVSYTFPYSDAKGDEFNIFIPNNKYFLRRNFTKNDRLTWLNSNKPWSWEEYLNTTKFDSIKLNYGK